MESLEQALAKGRSLARAGQVDEAIEVFEKACEYFGRDPEPWYYLAAAHYRQGQFAEAKKAIMEVLSRQPNHPKAIELNNRIPRDVLAKPAGPERDRARAKKKHRQRAGAGLRLGPILVGIVVFFLSAAAGYWGIHYLTTRTSERSQRPAASGTTAPRTKTPVTVAHFERLREGMSLENVEALFGRPGVLQYSEVRNGKHQIHYVWANEDESSIVLIFEENRLLRGDHHGLDGATAP